MSELHINDLHLHPMLQQASSKIILRYADHLLRRVGQVEMRHLPGGTQTDFVQRVEADELWAVLRGRVKFFMIDERTNSPTHALRDEISLADQDHHALLIPYGVAYAIDSEQDSQLLRITTHADGMHHEDRSYPRSSSVDRITRS